MPPEDFVDGAKDVVTCPGCGIEYPTNFLREEFRSDVSEILRSKGGGGLEVGSATSGRPLSANMAGTSDSLSVNGRVGDVDGRVGEGTLEMRPEVPPARFAGELSERAGDTGVPPGLPTAPRPPDLKRGPAVPAAVADRSPRTSGPETVAGEDGTASGDDAGNPPDGDGVTGSVRGRPKDHVTKA
jgi:hypothetical protein